MNIKVMYHGSPELKRINQGDWIDLYTAEEAIVFPGEMMLISLGVAMELPFGFEAHIVPRSSTFIKWGVMQANSFGVIDNSYNGPNDIWKFPAFNPTENTSIIPAHTRICQFRVVPKMCAVDLEKVKTLNNDNRGGFGSTGENNA